jgi:hypothetical protein
MSDGGLNGFSPAPRQYATALNYGRAGAAAPGAGGARPAAAAQQQQQQQLAMPRPQLAQWRRIAAASAASQVSEPGWLAGRGLQQPAVQRPGTAAAPAAPLRRPPPTATHCQTTPSASAPHLRLRDPAGRQDPHQQLAAAAAALPAGGRGAAHARGRPGRLARRRRDQQRQAPDLPHPGPQHALHGNPQAAQQPGGQRAAGRPAAHSQQRPGSGAVQAGPAAGRPRPVSQQAPAAAAAAALAAAAAAAQAGEPAGRARPRRRLRSLLQAAGGRWGRRQSPPPPRPRHPSPRRPPQPAPWASTSRAGL